MKEGGYHLDYETVRLEDATYFVPAYARHRPACQAALGGRFYEPDTHRLVGLLMAWRPGSMVHAGTFFGDMLPSFSRKCPGTVYAFEPVLENYVLARLCVLENDLANVALHHAALGERIGVARVETHTQSTHRGGASRIAAAGQLTTVTTIDSLGAPDVNVIELDVEGYELPALQGAAATLDRCRPVVLVEDNRHACGPFLTARAYLHLGSVPGLHIWAPNEGAGALREVLVGAGGR